MDQSTKRPIELLSSARTMIRHFVEGRKHEHISRAIELIEGALKDVDLAREPVLYGDCQSELAGALSLASAWVGEPFYELADQANYRALDGYRLALSRLDIVQKPACYAELKEKIASILKKVSFRMIDGHSMALIMKEALVALDEARSVYTQTDALKLSRNLTSVGEILKDLWEATNDIDYLEESVRVLREAIRPFDAISNLDEWREVACHLGPTLIALAECRGDADLDKEGYILVSKAAGMENDT